MEIIQKQLKDFSLTDKLPDVDSAVCAINFAVDTANEAKNDIISAIDAANDAIEAVNSVVGIAVEAATSANAAATKINTHLDEYSEYKNSTAKELNEFKNFQANAELSIDGISNEVSTFYDNQVCANEFIFDTIDAVSKNINDDYIELIAGSLSNLNFNPDDFTNFEYIADKLRDIVTAFGGNIENEGVSEIQFKVTEDDIAAGRSSIVFLTNPLLIGSDQSEDSLSIQVEKINL